jgi:copper resistance protein C
MTTPLAGGPPHRRFATRPRRGPASALAMAAAAVLLVLGSGPALAHDGLASTSPSADEALAAPEAVVLEFTGPPQSFGTQVVVTGRDGATVSDGAVEILDGTVTQPLAAHLPAGDYAVEWRVTSSDGHPISGSFGFTVATPAGAGGAATVVPSAPVEKRATDVDEASATTEDGSSATGAWIAAAGAVAAASVLLVVRRSRTRADDDR